MTQTKVHPSVALRRAWSKFGDSAGLAPGPDANSTSLAETVALILSCGISNNPSAEEPAETEKKPQNISILCRICKGNHFTTKCPFKDTYQPLDVVQSSLESAKESVSAPEGGATGARYVPPSARNRGGPGGEGMTMAGGAMPPSRRDEFPTIRITNLSEDTQEADVRTLVRKFGTPNRVFVARDRDLDICKGYAFVSFVSQFEGQRALEGLNGFGYDNLILRVEWSSKD